MGIVCPLGNDVETLWQAILAGRSGVAKTTIFDGAAMTIAPAIHIHAAFSDGFARIDGNAVYIAEDPINVCISSQKADGVNGVGSVGYNIARTTRPD